MAARQYRLPNGAFTSGVQAGDNISNLRRRYSNLMKTGGGRRGIFSRMRTKLSASSAGEFLFTPANMTNQISRLPARHPIDLQWWGDNP